ncbi:MAG: DNA-directed RNA polymerase subunit alpha C-terminal domain-containing protein [Mucilaginibacter sp.]
METNNTIPFIKLAKPAQRALAGAGIKTVNQLALLTESELIQLHGIGKNALQTLKVLMADSGLSFKTSRV